MSACLGAWVRSGGRNTRAVESGEGSREVVGVSPSRKVKVAQLLRVFSVMVLDVVLIA